MTMRSNDNHSLPSEDIAGNGAGQNHQNDRYAMILTFHKDWQRLHHQVSAMGWAVAEKFIRLKSHDLIILDLRDNPQKIMEEFMALRSAGCLAGHILVLAGSEQTAFIDRAFALGASQLLLSPFDDYALMMQLKLSDILSGRPGFALARTGCDHLTGLPDGESIRASLRQWLRDNEGDDRVHGLLLGLRRLDNINNIYGMETGDKALVTTVTRIQEFIQRHGMEGDICARLSGNNFLLISRKAEDRRQWGEFAEKLIGDIMLPLVCDGHKLRLGARGAIAIAKEGENALSFLNRMMSALGFAHESEVQMVRWADRQADQSPLHGYQLEQDIIHSLEKNEISIAYQPQFFAQNGNLSGVEALARWRHDDYGLIDAGTMFALAEKNDFTRPLSEHIRFLALTEAVKWPKSINHIRLALNLTAQDIASPKFLEQIALHINVSEFPAHRLTFEITETALMPNLEKAKEKLLALKKMGASIAIDDFGTGYSNFLYLRQLPIDYLKLDKSLLTDAVDNGQANIILRAIIAMANALNVRIIAEGVEHSQQLEMLKKEGCDIIQGFLRARPMSSSELVEFAQQQ